MVSEAGVGDSAVNERPVRLVVSDAKPRDLPGFVGFETWTQDARPDGR